MRGEEVKTGIGDNFFKKVDYEEEVAGVGTCCERFKQFEMLCEVVERRLEEMNG